MDLLSKILYVLTAVIMVGTGILLFVKGFSTGLVDLLIVGMLCYIIALEVDRKYENS